MPHNNKLIVAFTFAAAVSAAGSASAQTPAPAEPSGQVIVPQVDRREVKLPRYASRDFSFGLFTGIFATQNFGTSSVSGLRLGYHITEDVFVEATLASTQVSDEDFRLVFPNVTIFGNASRKLTYYNVMAGYNVLPMEVFFSKRYVKAAQGYVLAGVGSTDFVRQKRQTVSAGFGMRVMFKDWFAAQVDVRDHIFSLDLLGKRSSTQNLEITAGLSVYF